MNHESCDHHDRWHCGETGEIGFRMTRPIAQAILTPNLISVMLSLPCFLSVGFSVSLFAGRLSLATFIKGSFRNSEISR
jgi:hypothetical protein